MTTSPIEQAADTFARELARWRVDRGLTKKQLAARMGFDPSYVSHVEGRRHRPTEDFARRAEAVLHAGGAIWRRFQDYDELRHNRNSSTTVGRDPPVNEQWLPPGTGLVVEREQADLSYQDGMYRCVVRRALYNAGTEPVTRYLVRVAVDRYPNEPERSNRYHRDHPLTWEELSLRGHCGEPPVREPMDQRPKQDRDAFKEVWLLFENDEGRFPLYPGQRTTIDYTYAVGADKWGQWFQRAVRLPSRELAVRLDFPTHHDPVVWGVETSLSAEEAPLRTPLERRVEGDRTVFEWSTQDPPLNARYRLEWRFRPRGVTDETAAPEPESEVSPGASRITPVRPRPPVERVDVAGADLADARAGQDARMRAVGIIQRGDEILAEKARHFQLPGDEAVAREVVARLLATLKQVDELHPFRKGVGLAAPQLGLPWAAAVVRPPDPQAEPFVLLNPRVVDESAEVDEQYEGCLSFFDVRGSVRRPLALDVEHARWDGSQVITTFERGVARLVAHEIDHLEGLLYVDRLAPGAHLVPANDYRGTGRPWRY